MTNGQNDKEERGTPHEDHSIAGRHLIDLSTNRQRCYSFRIPQRIMSREWPPFTARGRNSDHWSCVPLFSVKCTSIWFSKRMCKVVSYIISEWVNKRKINDWCLARQTMPPFKREIKIVFFFVQLVNIFFKIQNVFVHLTWLYLVFQFYVWRSRGGLCVLIGTRIHIQSGPACFLLAIHL